MYSEVNSILNSLGEEYISKIPKDIYDIVITLKDDEYNPKLDIHKSLKNQNVSKEAVAMICNFHIRYWCEDVEERKRIKAMINPNSKTHNIKSTSIQEKDEDDNNETGIIVTKEDIISKILKWYYNL